MREKETETRSDRHVWQVKQVPETGGRERERERERETELQKDGVCMHVSVAVCMCVSVCVYVRERVSPLWQKVPLSLLGP